MAWDPRNQWQTLASRPKTRRGVAKGTVAGLAALLLGRAPVVKARAQSGTPEATPCPPTTAEESRAIGEAYFAAFNAGDADALGAMLAPDYRHAGAMVTEQDRELHQERVRANLAAFPDLHYELGDIIAQDDLVAVRWIFTGTLQGSYAGVEPAGQPVAVRGVHIHRIACGQIVEAWNSGDALGLLRQIGALPAPGASPRTPLEAQVGPAASPVADECPPEPAEEAERIVRRWTEEALDTHDLDILDEIVSPDIVHHAGIFVDELGLEALKEDFRALLAAFPDAGFTADVVVVEGDRAAVRWTGRGTHEGDLQGIAPTGRPVVFTGINVYRIDCGMIVEGWSEPDALGLLRQLGVIPEVSPTAGTPGTPTN